MTGSAAGKRRNLVATIVIVVVAQALAVLAYLVVESKRGEPAPETQFRYERAVGVPELPSVDLLRHDGTIERTSQLRGRPVLLHFWATWCPPCRKELPELLRLAKEEGALQVVAITVDEDWGAVAKFFGGPIPREVVREPSAALAKMYEIGTLPDTYLLDGDGKAVLRFGGAQPWRTAAARDTLAPYLSR